MDQDDLPPQPKPNDSGFSGALGQTVAGFVWVAVFLAIAGGVLYAVTRWF